MGGLPRRATAIAQLVKENPNTIIVDSGNLTTGGDPGKLDIIASAMVKMGYCAVGVGDKDARLGQEFYKKLAEKKLTVVDTSPIADKSAVPFVLKTIDGIKVGILSFGAADPSVTVDDMAMRKARFVAFKEAREKSDILILLDQAGVATKDWIDRNAPRYGAPDIVIGGVKDSGQVEEGTMGRAHIMPVIFQAKELGVIDLEVVPGQEPKFDARRLPLDEKFAEDPDILKQINDAIQATGLQPPIPTPGDGTVKTGFVPKPVYSVNLCKACHLKQYEDWAQTKHAKALQTLVDQKKAVAECLPCHSERYRATSQLVVPMDGIAGVECATCHADSLPHGMERRQMTVRAQVRPETCLQCHTKDRSPEYNEKTFFPKVAHGTMMTGPATARVPDSSD